MAVPVPVAAEDTSVARRLLSRHAGPAAGWEVLPEGLARRRRDNRRTPPARVPAVTVRDTRATGTIVDARQCLVCGAPVARVEDRGKRAGGSRAWPCGCAEEDSRGVLCGDVVVRPDRVGDLVAWLTGWADGTEAVGVDGRPWLVELDSSSGRLVFVTP